MSIYTTEVRYICESLSSVEGDTNEMSINEIIGIASEKIFEEYPIFDENYRSVLNAKILKHFYTREIGYETYGLWKLKLNTKMQEIMPYYNEVYKTTLYEYNPVIDTDYTIEKEGTKDEDDTNTKRGTNIDIDTKDLTNTLGGTTKVDNDHKVKDTIIQLQKDLFSKTPSGGLNGVLNGEYLTEARVIDNSKENEEIGESHSLETHDKTYKETGNINRNNTYEGSDKFLGKTTEKYTETIIGRRGGVNYSKLIKDFRESLINIDMMIIDELRSLFMNLW